MNNADYITIGRFFGIILGVIFLAWIVYLIKNLFIHRRINKFAVTGSDKHRSLQDKVNNIFKGLMSIFIKLFRNNFIINKIASNYTKYIDTKDELIMFVLIKFLIVIVLNGLYTLYALTGYYDFNIVIFILIMVLGFISPDYVTKRAYRKRMEDLNNDLFNALIIMNNAFKANLNIVKAIELVASELDGPIKNEFIKLNNDLNKGLELDIAFDRFYERVKLDEVKHLTMTLSLVHKTGGNVGELFDGLLSDFNTKRKLRNELRILSSTSLLIYQVLLIIPPVICLVIYYIDSSYYDQVVTSLWGLLILIVGLIFYFTYIFVIEYIIRRVFND